MEDLITFIDSFALDEKLFWQLKNVYTEESFELTWSRERGASDRWALRPVSSQEWQALSSKDLVEGLNKAQIDIEHAKSQLGATIITQAVFASLVVEAAEKLFGRSTLEQAFTNTNQFLVKVLEAAQTKAKPALKIVQPNEV